MQALAVLSSSHLTGLGLGLFEHVAPHTGDPDPRFPLGSFCQGRIRAYGRRAANHPIPSPVYVSICCAARATGKT